MPIVVAILGVIIVVMGVLFFTMSPAEPTPAAGTEEVNRTESMEMDTEAEIEIDTTINPETSLNDTTATLASTYTGSGTYLTPARTSHKIDVTLTVEGGIVTNADVVYDGGAGFSNPNQERFDGAYKAQVVGKSLSEISLSRVGGASLTSAAFNEAVASIRATQT
jgi:hypothetical protein